MTPRSKKAYYRISTQGSPSGGQYLVTKLNGYLDKQASYAMYYDFTGQLICNCPSRKRPCKHTRFLDIFKCTNQINGSDLFDADKEIFVPMDEVE
jgi:hypothetical protein